MIIEERDLLATLSAREVDLTSKKKKIKPQFTFQYSAHNLKHFVFLAPAEQKDTIIFISLIKVTRGGRDDSGQELKS